MKSLPFRIPECEKGTPFGRSLPVWAIIGSTPGAKMAAAPPAGGNFEVHRVFFYRNGVSLISTLSRKCVSFICFVYSHKDEVL